MVSIKKSYNYRWIPQGFIFLLQRMYAPLCDFKMKHEIIFICGCLLIWSDSLLQKVQIRSSYELVMTVSLFNASHALPLSMGEEHALSLCSVYLSDYHFTDVSSDLCQCKVNLWLHSGQCALRQSVCLGEQRRKPCMIHSNDIPVHFVFAVLK